jgi:hypothetical protein
MIKPCPTDTTVLLLHQDKGLKEDPYFAYLRTVPELTDEKIEAIALSQQGLGNLIKAIRDLAKAPANMSPENVDRLRAILLELDEGRLQGDQIGTAIRRFAAETFHGTPGAEEFQDLDTWREGITPDTHGTPPDLDWIVFETGWAEWRADRARLREAGSVLDDSFDVLMLQLCCEGVDAKEAEEAVADMLERDLTQAKATLPRPRNLRACPPSKPSKGSPPTSVPALPRSKNASRRSRPRT